MRADPTLLNMKYSRVIRGFAERSGKTYRGALDFFYRSLTYAEMSRGIADFHCMSDGYLVDELCAEMENTTHGV